MAIEIKVLARGDSVPLDLQVRSNLVQQELTRLGVNSIALLNRTVNVAPDVMGKLRDLIDREVDRHYHEWMETMQRLTITERTERRPVTIRSRDVERDCRSIVNQLVNSMPKDVLLRTPYKENRAATYVQTTEEVRVKSRSSVTRKVQLTNAKKSSSRARTVHLGTKNCPGSHALSGPNRTACPGRQFQDNPGTEFCPGCRI